MRRLIPVLLGIIGAGGGVAGQRAWQGQVFTGDQVDPVNRYLSQRIAELSVENAKLAKELERRECR